MTKIGVAYYTPVALCAEVPGILRKVVEQQDKCKVVRCGMIGFGDSSLDYELQYDVYSDLYDFVFDARHKVSIGILRAFGEAHVDFAWPTQVAIAAGSDGRPVEDGSVQSVPPALIDSGPTPTSGEKAPDSE